MRAYSSRTAWLLIALAATAGWAAPLRADQRVLAEPAPSGPIRITADPLASFPLPDLPPAVLRLTTDVTGSIRRPEAPAGPADTTGLVPSWRLDAGTVVSAGFDPAGGSRREPALPVPATAALAAPLSPPLDARVLEPAVAAFSAARTDGGPPELRDERQRIRVDIAAFYAARAFAPIWVADGRLTPAARSVLERLDRAAEDGLDLRGFALPRDSDPDGLARAELAVSEAAVAYGRQASGSRVDVGRLSGIIDMRPAVADAATILALVPGAADAGDALRDFNPPQPGYAALRDTLAELRRRRAPEARDGVRSGTPGHAGTGDARVPLVHARFDLGPGPSDSPADRTRVAAAGAPLQRTATATGSDALDTLDTGNPQQLESALVANMEEWRWLPRDLGPDRIEVNIPDFEVRVMRDGTVVHQARVVVGKPDKPTPVFSQIMTFMIVNPYWNVPLSIINKEMMPKLAADPNYFQDHGYEVVERNGVTYVRQPPGDDNALGRIKFMFPNSHAVYLHDTNARSFFGRDKRALSHGCVRVDRPFAFAEAVLGRQNGWTEARVQKLVGGTERVVNLPEPLPIHIVYFTAFVDPKTGFQRRDDVYGYMGRIEKALGLRG